MCLLTKLGEVSVMSSSLKLVGQVLLAFRNGLGAVGLGGCICASALERGELGGGSVPSDMVPPLYPGFTHIG